MPLPPPIAEVTVPDCFSPSALGSAGDCRLKLIIASLRRDEWGERLASGPEAAVGTLLHRVLERAGRETTATAQEIFEEEYEQVIAEIRLDPRRSHFAELAATKSLAEWTRLKSFVLARAARESPVTPARVSRARAARPMAGTEIPLESLSLRLRGKADRIRQLGPRLFEVRDFKTGVVLDEDGEIKAEIALQLQAYGLLLLERRPGAEIRLVVDDGVEREVPFDDDAKRAAREALKRITGSMPPPGRAAAQALTQPGRACWGCSIRHVCPRYRSIAPGWWKQYPPEIDRLSHDIWGTVLEVLGSGPVGVILRDDAGRRVRIDGVDVRHGISTSFTRSRMWFFGLEASGTNRGFDGVRFHPRSLHELPRDRLERRAWALHVFVETESSR